MACSHFGSSQTAISDEEWRHAASPKDLSAFRGDLPLFILDYLCCASGATVVVFMLHAAKCNIHDTEEGMREASEVRIFERRTEAPQAICASM